jgi:hypothetical protein
MAGCRAGVDPAAVSGLEVLDSGLQQPLSGCPGAERAGQTKNGVAMMIPRLLLAGLAALAIAGCAQEPTASRETLLRATAVVDSVDQSTRQVRLTDQAGGGTRTVTAGPEVRNLA